MNQANKDFLKRYERNYETLKQADFIGHLELSTRQELARIAREEFDPNYTCCVTCQEDIFQLVKYVYGQAEKAEKEEARQAAHEKSLKADEVKNKPPTPDDDTSDDKSEEGIMKMTFPKVENEPYRKIVQGKTSYIKGGRATSGTNESNIPKQDKII